MSLTTKIHGEDIAIPPLSTGDASTLGNYLKLCNQFRMHKAAAYIEDKIATSPKGENEPVLTDEGQMVYLLTSMEK